MNRVMTIAITLLLMGSLSGCVKEDPEDALPEGYKRSLQKADDVEKTLQDTANKRLGELEASSQ
jgi:hypothetical protein